MSQLLVVDDHPIVLQGLVQFLSSMPEIQIIRQASSGKQALEEFRSHRPDAVVLDLTLGADSGMDVLKQMRDIDTLVPVMFLTMHDEMLHGERALAGGARGYVMKHEATETVISAVRRLLAGEMVFSRKLQDKVMQNFSNRNGARHTSGISALTARELEVLGLIGKGHSTADIAVLLSRSVKTIEAHRASIRGKLGLQSTFELVRYAMRWNNE